MTLTVRFIDSASPGTARKVFQLLMIGEEEALDSPCLKRIATAYI